MWHLNLNLYAFKQNNNSLYYTMKVSIVFHNSTNVSHCSRISQLPDMKVFFLLFFVFFTVFVPSGKLQTVSAIHLHPLHRAKFQQFVSRMRTRSNLYNHRRFYHPLLVFDQLYLQTTIRFTMEGP